MKNRNVLSLLFVSLVIIGSDPEPYASINNLPFDDHGWFINANQLREKLSEYQPKIVIEVGSWLGASTRFIADCLPEGSVVYAVDTWRGSLNEDVQVKDPRAPYLYQLFLSNVKHAHLTGKIVPVRMESLEAAKALNIKADLIYIDGDHATEAVKKDILAWYQHLAPNGLMCGDDWLAECVRTAVIECAELLHKRIRTGGQFWWYES